MKVEFTIPGPPVAKGRPRFSTADGKIRAYTPEKTANYEELVRWSYPGGKLEGMICARIWAYFGIPKNTSKKEKSEMGTMKILHTKKPDADNIAKAILDALNGIAYDDDGQVCLLSVMKLYDENPHAEVELEEIET